MWLHRRQDSYLLDLTKGDAMQFTVVAYDHRDSDAPTRRMNARNDHVALGDKMRDAGQLLYAVAILNDVSQMIGSIMIVDLPSKGDLDHWLSIEPYLTGKVWDTVQVLPCRVGPSFARATPTAAS